MSTRFLSVLLNARLFPTSGFCTRWLLCLECASFCFSHDSVLLILQILTEMSLPQQSLSWPYYLKLVSPFTIFALHFLCNTCHNWWLFYLFLWLFVIWVLYNARNSGSSGLVSVFSLCFFRAWQNPCSVLFEWMYITSGNVMVFLVKPWWIWLLYLPFLF